MKNNHLKLYSLWKKGSTLTLGLGLLSGGMSTQAATDCNAVTSISTVECESLLELYHSTNGAKWRDNEGWNVTNTPCSWSGVSCENGGVTKIALYSKLTGAIPDFSALPNLQTLYLPYNQLTGAMPDFSALPNLQTLALYSNQLIGMIPDFIALPNLQTLALYSNQLTGTIPDFIALPNLQTLWLSENQLTGTIPDFIALPNLQELYLSSNQLTGAIPDFSALPNLQNFRFNGNQLTLMETNCNAVTQISKIECESLLELYHSTNGAGWSRNDGWNVTNTPCFWYGVTCENGGVSEIYLGSFSDLSGSFNYSNNLNGTLPNFRGLPNLQTLYLFENYLLTGDIPDFTALPNLQTLYLGWNGLSGDIPDFTALPNLRTLYLLDNQLTGAIPDFGGLPQLQELNLYGNELTGAIPDFSALPQLQELDLRNNQLTGAIPDFSALPNLQNFSFSGNQLTLMDTNCNAVTQISKVECESLLELYHSTNGAHWKYKERWNVTNTPCFWSGVTCENGGVTQIELSNLTGGTIPDFSGLPNLQTLSLSENYLTGEIPDFSALPNLQVLDLYWNQLTGEIPDFSALPNLQTLSLFENQLTGAIPDFSALPNLQGLYLHYNQLTGAIPNFSALPNLQGLYLHYNQLTGAIPNFSALPNLQNLYLDENQMTGEIPDFSASPNLQTLSLSDNHLTGAIPDFSALPNLQVLYLHDNKVCKDTNISYSSWQEELKEELNTFSNCPVSPPSATVKMQLNQSRYTTDNSYTTDDNSLRLDMQVSGEAKADLYIAIVFPDGDFMTIAYPLSFSWLNAIQIYQPAVEIVGEKIYPIMDFPLPAGIPTGGYHACGVLVLAGKYHSEYNWIDKHCVGFEVY